MLPVLETEFVKFPVANKLVALTSSDLPDNPLNPAGLPCIASSGLVTVATVAPRQRRRSAADAVVQRAAGLRQRRRGQTKHQRQASHRREKILRKLCTHQRPHSLEMANELLPQIVPHAQPPRQLRRRKANSYRSEPSFAGCLNSRNLEEDCPRVTRR